MQTEMKEKVIGMGTIPAKFSLLLKRFLIKYPYLEKFIRTPFRLPCSNQFPI